MYSIYVRANKTASSIDSIMLTRETNEKLIRVNKAWLLLFSTKKLFPLIEATVYCSPTMSQNGPINASPNKPRRTGKSYSIRALGRSKTCSILNRNSNSFFSSCTASYTTTGTYFFWSSGRHDHVGRTFDLISCARNHGTIRKKDMNAEEKKRNPRFTRSFSNIGKRFN